MVDTDNIAAVAQALFNEPVAEGDSRYFAVEAMLRAEAAVEKYDALSDAALAAAYRQCATAWRDARRELMAVVTVLERRGYSIEE